MKEKLKRMRHRWVGVVGVALVLALLMTAFPVHITQDSTHIGEIGVLTVGRSQYHITIGRSVGATTADYTCDGTDDDVQFQAALDALPASGGQLLVLTGDYDFANATTVTRAIDDVSIIGVGASVYFSCDASTAIFTAGGNNWLLSNFETDAGGLAMGATTDWMWLNITIDTTYYALDTEDDPAVDTSGTPVDNDFAKFTDEDTVEGRNAGEVRTDLALVPDTNIPSQASFDDHSAEHENAGADEISVAGLSGLLADDQHVLDAEVQAIKLDDFATPDDNTDLDSSLTEHGLLPKLGGGSTNFFRADGTWATPAGGGDVSGPASSTDHMIARHDGSGGKTLIDYTSNPPTISDTGDMNIDGDLDVENIVVSGNVDGRDVSVDGTKLDGIAAGATVYPDTGEQAFLDADHTKLDGIAAGATVYPDTGEQAFLDADHTKLDGIAAGADVTGSNAPQAHAASHAVSAADTLYPADPNADKYLMWDDDPGNLIWSTPGGAGDVTGPGASTDNMIARHSGTSGKTLQDYTSNPPTISDSGDMNIDGDLDVENIVVSGNVDGRDVSADGTKLDGVEASADVTDATNVNTAGAVMEVDYNVHSILIAVSDDTPVVLSVGEQTLVGRLTGGNIAALSIGITDNYLVQIDSADVASTEYARFTANGLESRTEAEFKADFNLEIGTDVLAQQTIGIADDNLVEVDDADAADDDYAKFTANGLEGRSYAEVSSDLGIQSNVITITFIIDGGGSAITTGEKGHLEIPFACTITGWTILADQSGSIVIDVWKDTYANFPPLDADSIAGTELPTLSSAQKNQDLALGSWTTAVTAGDILAYNVDSVATVERITLSIRATKT